MLRQPFSKELIEINKWDVIVIGAGAAGLMASLELPKNLQVLLLNRNTNQNSSSRWAQGGIASVVRPDDSFDSHIQDTVNAGDGLCDLKSVEMLVKDAPNCVKMLQKLGMIFDKDSNELSTTLEAAHSFRRVLHVKDRTGRALVEVLEDHVENKKNVLHCRGVRVINISVKNGCCYGVQVLDGSNLYWIQARAIVLATGGGGHLFANTTNPPQSAGEGIALAWSAGAAIDDLEFVQFHPTALKFYGAPCFLISEALRGEGAVLVDDFGNSPVSKLQDKELSTRDQVSRAVMSYMKDNNIDHVGLDLRFIQPNVLIKRFPTILSRCQEYGINPLNELIPVAPAAHYWMGGVHTEMNASTTIKGLYAIGEVASTGVHGANRLASNSLMECLVFARKLSEIDIGENNAFKSSKRTFIQSKHIDLNNDFCNKISNKIDYFRKLCWEYLGVSRSKENMENFLKEIQIHSFNLIQNELFILTKELDFDKGINLSEPNRRDLNLIMDLHNRLITTKLLLDACIFREESRGGHFRFDFPNKSEEWKCHSRQIKEEQIKKTYIKN